MACSLIYDKTRSVSISVNRPKCSKSKKTNKNKSKKNDKKDKNAIVTSEVTLSEQQEKDKRGNSDTYEAPTEEYSDELFSSEVEAFRNVRSPL